jgi:SAM-dependent methyltransferase
VDVTNANSEAIEAWNTILFDKFVRFRELVVTGFRIHGERVLERFPPREGARVLDVGCGFGDTTLAIARRVGPRGEAVGVDAAARFIDLAARDAKETGVSNARFIVADVQSDPHGGPYDQVFSRFGTMFFVSPVAAFRNIRRSLAKDGRLTMVVWRKKEESGFWNEVEQRILPIVPNSQKKEGDVTCGPGPFSLGSADLASAQLVAAGFGRITFERVDAEVRVGTNVDDAIEYAMAIGPAGELLRLAKEEGERKKPEVIAALRDLFTPLARPDGVWGRASSWIVSAEPVS